MKLLLSIAFTALLPVAVLSQTTFPKAPPVQPGVAYQLAVYRKAVLHNIAYQLDMVLPPVAKEPVQATETVTFELASIQAPLQLDFKAKETQLHELEVNGKATPIVFKQEHLVLPTALLRKGNNTVKIMFTAGDQSLNRNGDYLYTLLVPDRARTLFPCFDQPDLKAVFTLSLHMTDDWAAIANAPLHTRITDMGKTDCYFEPSDTIPTYLFSFVAGRFRQEEQQRGGRTMHFLYRETDSAKLRASMDKVFDIHAQALHFLEDYTGIAYPFKKFDFAAIPDFQFGGMEHVGAIQYQAGTLFLDSSATREQLISRSVLLSHETSHMWFGDLVTMRWFNDVWMKEVFANLMADKITNITLPDGKADLKFLTGHYPAAYSVDRTQGKHPIRQQLDNLQDAGSLYGNIIYHKAPIMMRQLELLMGADAFRDGLREYLKKYAFGNASWPELINILDAHTPADLQAWNKVWVNEAGRPAFSYTLRMQAGKVSSLQLTQHGEDGSNRIWPQHFSIAMVYRDHTDMLPVDMRTASMQLPQAAGKPLPLYWVFNADGQGYGLFPVDNASLKDTIAGGLQIPVLLAIQDPVPRAAAYINLYEHMLNGQDVRPQRLLDMELHALQAEPEELNLGLLLDHIQTIFWRFTPAAQRAALAEKVEAALWNALQRVAPANQKKLLFKAYANIALSAVAQDRLYACWKNKQPPAGVQLSEDDYTNLACALAVRNYTNATSILKQQLERIQNPDRRQRLQFLLPALSNEVGVRDTFFAALKDPANREKEAWVLAALGYLHHPLRAATSEKYLPQSLEWLLNIQRTGDVFFPQSWLQASFGNYQTATAAAIVKDFLKKHPGYNAKLRDKILQAADGVFRAQQLVEKQ